MILLELFIGFLKVGCFAFGGAYGAIPLIRDVVLSYGWLDDEMLTYMIAVSESTPGPIMVNLATYVGSSQAGILGSIVSTLAVVLPSFIIILLVTALLKTILKKQICSGCSEGLEAVHDRDHSCYRSLYDPQEWYRYSGKHVPDPTLGTDAGSWSDILRLQEDKERRYFPDPSDLYLRRCRDCCLWTLKKINTNRYMARRLYTVSWLCSFSGEAHNRAHLCLGGVSQRSIQSAADDECVVRRIGSGENSILFSQIFPLRLSGVLCDCGMLSGYAAHLSQQTIVR